MSFLYGFNLILLYNLAPTILAGLAKSCEECFYLVSTWYENIKKKTREIKKMFENCFLEELSKSQWKKKNCTIYLDGFTGYKEVLWNYHEFELYCNQMSTIVMYYLS